MYKTQRTSNFKRTERGTIKHDGKQSDQGDLSNLAGFRGGNGCIFSRKSKGIV